MLCNEVALNPDNCDENGLCSCTHMLVVNLGEVIELVLVDQSLVEESHPFHLHGYKFYVVAMQSRELRGLFALLIDHIFAEHRLPKQQQHKTTAFKTTTTTHDHCLLNKNNSINNT
jgi:FtsP/CotA-like multicopper oxidase with cupredoxin domain